MGRARCAQSMMEKLGGQESKHATLSLEVVSQSINVEDNNLQFSLTVKGYSIYKTVHF